MQLMPMEAGCEPRQSALLTLQCDKYCSHGREASSWDTEETILLGDGITDQEGESLSDVLRAGSGPQTSALASWIPDPALIGLRIAHQECWGL